METQRVIPTLEISTLGGLQMKCDGEIVSGLVSRKAEALLVYLASTGRPYQREILADLFWDNRTQTQAAANLRTVLSNLRKHLGAYLAIDRYAVATNPENDYWIDTIELEAVIGTSFDQDEPASLIKASQLEMALGLYKGDFLEGFHLRSCQNFDEWIIIERERLRNLVITALQKLVRHHINSGNFKSAIPYLRQVLDLNPLLETAHQQLMKSLTFIGQRESALNQFDICRAILKEELSVSPSDDTRELFEQIKSGKLLLPDATARHNQKHHRKQ